jgi:uncharacterized phage protein (TIGR01671 family)
MNRPIKFRARLIDGRGTGSWVYGTFAKHIGHYVIFDDSTGERHIVDPTTLGQFVDLGDVNGKEIYEGDIVRRKRPCFKPNGTRNGSSEDEIEVAYFQTDRKNGFNLSSAKHCTVIGNIYSGKASL